MNNGEYHGRRNKPKNYAIQKDIADLAGRIDGNADAISSLSEDLTELETTVQNLNLNVDSDFLCFPANGGGHPITQAGTNTDIAIDHPAMGCIDVCVFDTVLGRYVALGVSQNGNTQTILRFATAPPDGRYLVTITGKNAS